MKMKKHRAWIIYMVAVIAFLSVILFCKIKDQERLQLLKYYTEKAQQDVREVEHNIQELQRTLQYISKNPVIQKVFLDRYTDSLKANKDVSENVEGHLWYMITRKTEALTA